MAEFSGTPDNDTIVGSPGDDTIHGGDGNDTITDQINLDQLNDDEHILPSTGGGYNTVFGDGGDDVINIVGVAHGGDGNDTITLQSILEYDLLSEPDAAAYGDAGDDSINALGGANHTLDGGTGDDTIVAGTGADFITGGAGYDRITGGDGYAWGTVAFSGPRSNYVISQTNGTWIFQDTVGGDGTDTVSGVEYAQFFDQTMALHSTIILGPGADTYDTSVFGDTVFGMGGDDTLNGKTGGDMSDSLDGGDGNDYIYDEFGANTLLGEDGNDTVLGGGGNDTISGGDGADSLSGGDDNDSIDGGAGNDTIDGGGGADFISDYAGAGSISGGDGNDTIYYVDNAGDVVSEESTGAGINDGGGDRVFSTVDFTLGNFLENLNLQGAANLNGTGNSLNNGLNGNSGNNSLSGLGGADTVNGGAGDDTLAGGQGNDVLNGGAGADTFVFGAAGIENGTDTVQDFVHGTDTLRFTGTDYGFTAGHGLTGAEFTSGGSAVGASAQFVWDAATHTLYWDHDGAGGDAAVAIATFTGAVTITAGDFQFA